MGPPLSRRRFIGLTASAAGLSLLPLGAAAQAEARLVTWRGRVMGAAATLQVHHHDEATAGALIERAVAEVRRLEAIFSLYRADSALAELNRRGVLVAPPRELVELLKASRLYFEATGGAFDPTVQALWSLYAEHFSRRDADPNGPSEHALEAARERVGFDRVAFDPNRVALLGRGMALTLNGIAQGYATDRVVEILRAGGVERSLVDMGEPRALGRRPSGDPWRIGLADPDRPVHAYESLEIVDRAVATSGGYGFRFDGAGRFNHLFDPRTGLSAHLHRSVSVVHESATAADALSTAFAILPAAEMPSILRTAGGGEIRLVEADGTRRGVTA